MAQLRMTRMPEEIQALFRRCGLAPDLVMNYTITQDFNDRLDIAIIEVQLLDATRREIKPPENVVTLEGLSEKLDRVIEANDLYTGT